MTIHSYAIKIGDPEIERHFEDYIRKGDTEEAMAEVLLGDTSYVRRLRMPKYNGPVNMLREPAVAVRHAHELGIPGSKSVHAQREAYFQELFDVLDNAWQELVKQCVGLFGNEGPPRLWHLPLPLSTQCQRSPSLPLPRHANGSRCQTTP